MLNDLTVQQLMKLSTPRYFKAKEYICFEGQPGDEMYVVLKGSVGIYVRSALNNFAEVARILPGDFFGEMAMFDKLPRSASCIALEDTACIAINRGHLGKFIAACPEMAEKIIINMSERIRKLNDKIYKSKDPVLRSAPTEFKMPDRYLYSHDIEEPPRRSGAVETENLPCPVCGKDVPVTNVRQGMLSLLRTDSDRRPHYAECEPLWHYVRKCPHCMYSNYYLEFFKVPDFNADIVRRIINDHQAPEINKFDFKKTPFDKLFISYIQAIHINMNINNGNKVLIGNLWLYLYWLFTDAEDIAMTEYCRAKAIEYLLKAYDENEKSISDAESRQSVALTLTNLLLQAGDKETAARICNDAINYPDRNMRSEAYNLKNHYNI